MSYEIDSAQPDTESLLQPKRIVVNNTTLKTPAKALEVGKTTDSDQINQNSRGANELYAQVNRAKLERLRSGENDRLRSSIAKSYRKTEDDELNIVFLSMMETGQFDPANVETMLDLMVEFGDVVSVPLMPEIAEGIESDDTSDRYFRMYHRNARMFLNAANERDLDIPIMGVLPVVGQTQAESLIDLYLNLDVDGFCYDLQRRTITARAQQDALVRPLVRKLGTAGLRESVFIYLVNGRPYGMKATGGAKSAEYLLAYSLGIDIVGGNHVGLTADKETIAKITSTAEGEPETLRLLDRYTYGMVDVSVHDLDDFVPDDTGLDISRIKRSVRNGNNKSRYKKLINTEILSQIIDDLVASLDKEGAKELLQEKTGVPNPVIERLVTTKATFDDSDSQSGLSEF